MKISRQIASLIYDILVQIGAPEGMREAFIHSHSKDEFQMTKLSKIQTKSYTL